MNDQMLCFDFAADVNETLSPPPGFGQDPEIIDNTGSRQGGELLT